MKENVLDVLMYLFENYYMDDAGPVTPDRATVEQELSRAGFPIREIDHAFVWMDGLAGHETVAGSAGTSMRHYAAPELERLDAESRGFLLFLEQTGVLAPEMRELVIDRVMALKVDDFDIDQLKWVVMMVLFNQPVEETAYAWVEDLVLESTPRSLH